MKAWICCRCTCINYVSTTTRYFDGVLDLKCMNDKVVAVFSVNTEIISISVVYTGFVPLIHTGAGCIDCVGCAAADCVSGCVCGCVSVNLRLVIRYSPETERNDTGRALRLYRKKKVIPLRESVE